MMRRLGGNRRASSLAMAGIGLIAALAAAALSVSSTHGLRQPAPAARTRLGPSESLTALPASARGFVSQTLGATSRSYRIRAVAGGAATAANPAQALHATFPRSGLPVRSA